MTNLAIFASGSGSNAEQIIQHFSGANSGIQVSLLLCNNSNAHVLHRVQKYNVPSVVFSRTDLTNGEVLQILKAHNITMIVLAGFLWLMPKDIVHAYDKRIINIHPALLPKYGGKGMYGNNVHKAVKKNEEEETGITIHYVNEEYDKGHIIFQASCKLELHDTPESIAEKVHQLEHRHFAKVIEEEALKLLSPL
ncbi:MAG: phosphoribosylglycinamide formyltransferase [Bacteroidales bacterium]